MHREYESIEEDARRMQPAKRVAEYGMFDDGLGEMQYAIVRRNVTNGDLRRLAATCGSLPTYQYRWSWFTRDVFNYLIESIVDWGDRDLLLEVLSTRCPEDVGRHGLIEYYLVLRESKVKEPIVLLSDAYARCRDGDVRRHIAAAFRRGFTASGMTGKDDSEFVSNAVQWYTENRVHLKLNGRHGGPVDPVPPHEEGDPNFRSLSRYESFEPLFVERR